jgi:hypothetical protein
MAFIHLKVPPSAFSHARPPNRAYGTLRLRIERHIRENVQDLPCAKRAFSWSMEGLGGPRYGEPARFFRSAASMPMTAGTFFAVRSCIGSATIKETKQMKLLVIAVGTAAIVATSAHAQNTRRVLEPEARSGQPTTGVPQSTDPRTTTGQAPIAVPGAGSPYGAKGGATGNPNPDRVPPGTPGGASRPPGEGP